MNFFKSSTSHKVRERERVRGSKNVKEFWLRLRLKNIHFGFVLRRNAAKFFLFTINAPKMAEVKNIQIYCFWGFPLLGPQLVCYSWFAPLPPFSSALQFSQHFKGVNFVSLHWHNIWEESNSAGISHYQRKRNMKTIYTAPTMGGEGRKRIKKIN